MSRTSPEANRQYLRRRLRGMSRGAGLRVVSQGRPVRAISLHVLRAKEQ